MSYEFVINGIKSQFLKVENFENDAMLCVSKILDKNAIDTRKIFSDEELDRFNLFGSEKRKIHFLLGRFSAKQALFFQKNKKVASESDILNFNKLNIENGILGQPILHDEIFDVSISHSGILGGAIVFNKKFPMGLDLQEKNETRRRSLLSQITEKDIDTESLETITAIWSLKEAISKILRCGLTVTQNFLELQEFFEKSGDFRCKFKNFTHYQGIAQFIDHTVLSIVTPISKK